ncbi:MAG: aldo/keto reductase, partial [Planctomycetota bacterium]
GGATWGADPDDQESIRAIHASLDAGVNLIDTAPAYGWGHSEEVVGKAIQDRRDSVVLATKCGLIWEDDRGSPFAVLDGKMLRRSLRPDTIREEIDRSLHRLRTDVIDLYQTHWPSVEPDKTALEDTWACLLKIKDEGKVKSIGVCNCTLEELQANVKCGLNASHQLRYSMLFRGPEKDIFPYCQQQNLATLTYMSLEQGLLTGKIGMDRRFDEGEFRGNEAWNPWFKLENRPKVLNMLANWTDLTEKYDCTLAQLVIAWTVAQPGATHVLIGARNTTQAADNAAAATLRIDPADLARIRNDVQALGDPA